MDGLKQSRDGNADFVVTNVTRQTFANLQDDNVNVSGRI